LLRDHYDPTVGRGRCHERQGHRKALVRELPSGGERADQRHRSSAAIFTYLARMPDFDQNKLAFLLLLPRPNMPNLSLNRAEVADLTDYTGTTGTSGYAPGQKMQKKGSVKGTTGASGYAPGHADDTKSGTKSR